MTHETVVILEDVREDLDMSTVAGLTYLSSVQELEYIFSHLLIKDVAYDSILRRRRRELHGDVGRILESMAADTELDISAVLAYHFTQAEEWSTALEYVITSGLRASEEYRNEESISAYRRAISIIVEHLPDRTEDLRESYKALGDVLDTVGDYDASIEAWRENLNLTSDILERAVAVEAIAGIHFTRGELDRAESLLLEIESWLEADNPDHDPVRARLADFRAWASGVQGNLDEAMKQASAAVEVSRKIPQDDPKNRRVLGHSLNTLAMVHYASSDYEKALETYNEALEIARELNSTREVAVTEGNIGLVHQCLGRFSEAVEAIERQMELSLEIGDRLIIASSHGELASSFKPLGEFDRALHHAQSYYDISLELASTHDILISLGYLASINLDMGDLDRAQELAQQGLDLARGSGFEREARIDLRILGEILKRRGELEAARQALAESVEICRSITDREILPESLRILGEIDILLGDLASAREHIDESMAISRETGSRLAQIGAFIGMGRLHRAMGDTDLAVKNLEKAIELCEETGIRPALMEACREQGEVLASVDGQEERSATLLARAEELERELGLA